MSSRFQDGYRINKWRHVLLAEDEAEARRTMSIVLSETGFRVDEAADGLEALTMLTSLHASGRLPELLIMDVRMPRMDGMQLLARLGERGIRLPTLAITGYGSREILAELARVGCVKCLDKPFTPDELLDGIHGALHEDENVSTNATADCRIMIIDGRNEIGEALQNMLAAEGFKVAVFRDEYEALYAQTTADRAGHPFNVAILDLRSCGVIAAERLRWATPEIRIVVSGLAPDTSCPMEMAQAGVAAAITLPFRKEKVLETLRRVITEQRIMENFKSRTNLQANRASTWPSVVISGCA